MNTAQALQYINAQAMTPDQLLGYVSAVSGVQSELMNDYVVHKQGENTVLVGYSLQNPNNTEYLNTCIEKIIAKNDTHILTVLAPIRPSLAPTNATSSEQDAYWLLALPPTKLTVKVRNMLARSEREIYITKAQGQGAWTGAHQELMLNYIRKKGMEAALCSIMQRLSTYLITSKETMLFSAYSKDSEQLLACALGDFSSFSTAFYMFAFRQDNASPGVADAVFFELLNEAQSRGHSQCNLGLGINAGIRFFKQKWGAVPSLPFVQTTWQIENKNKSWFSRFID